MSIIPEVKCRRCGESFSVLRSRCPNCGTRRVTQSNRTPAPTPSTVKGTAAYERAETNTRWQMIFGLILVVAVILAVIVMVSTSLSGLDGQTGRGSKNNVVTTPSAVIESSAPTPIAPPTPTPTPPPSVEGISIQCFGTDVKDEFTMSLSRDPKITLQATVLPMEVFTAENTHIVWKSSDESLFTVTPSEDTRSCVIEMLKTGGPGTLTVTCNDYTVQLTVRFVN